MSVKCHRQKSAGNNYVYVAHIQNNTQNHVLLSTRDFYLNLQASITHDGKKISTPIYSHSRLRLTSSFSREDDGEGQKETHKEEEDEVRKHVCL